MNPDFPLKRAFRTTVLISGVMVAGLLLYALMVELIRSQLRPFPGLLASGIRHQTLRYFFFGAAIGTVVLIRFASRARFKKAPGEDFARLVSRLSRTAVVTSVLAELPAVIGFILFLLTGFSRDFYVLLFVSLFLEFMYFPRLKDWQDLARESFPQQGM